MSGRKYAGAAAAVFALAFLVHVHALGMGYTFDERILISGNPAVMELDLGTILGSKFWPGPTRGVYYRPTVILSYAAAYALAGDAPWAQHLVNLLAHAAASSLAFLLLMRLGQKAGPAFLVTAVFAVHPVHAENVFWVPGRTDVLATAFLLASWLSFLKAREGERAGESAPWYGLAGFLFLLALGAKEIAAVLPLLILARDLLGEARMKKRAKIEHVASFALLFLFLAWRWWVLLGPGDEPSPDPLSSLSYLTSSLTTAYIFAKAALTIVFPGSWKIDYAYEEAMLGAPGWALGLSLLFFLAMAAAVPALREKRPEASFAAAGFLIGMAPVSHLVPFPTLFAERFLYLPSLFLVLFVVELAYSWLEHGEEKEERTRVRKRPLLAAMAILIAALSLAEVSRGRHFKDDLSFWSEAVRQVPRLALARNWLGIAHMERADYAAAERLFKDAVSLDRDFYVARMNLAGVMLKTGRTGEAVELMETLVQEHPGKCDLLMNLSVAYSMNGRIAEAVVAEEAARRACGGAAE